MGDRYNTLYELGAGAFGKAWVVKDNKTQKKCVSKVIQIKGLSSIALDRCVTEVAVLSACSHINIVRYIEAFVSGGALHIMMEYASGGDLQQKIEKQNGVFFASDAILGWFLQVIMALEYIHSKNILHRDLKPQNIFLTDNGIVKLGDFGIARVLKGCDDLASTRIGTPFYISPEICQRKSYNISSDMWAAGCLLYQMCSLDVPFHASNFDDLTKKIIKADYDPVPSQFSPAIQQIISNLLVSTPSERLSAMQLLSLSSVRGMVLYLKQKYHVKGQTSRTRSSSLVTDRSKKSSCQRSRSSSVNSSKRNPIPDSEETLVPDLKVKGHKQDKEIKQSSRKLHEERRNLIDSKPSKISEKNGWFEIHIGSSDNQIKSRYRNEKKTLNMPRGHDSDIKDEGKIGRKAYGMDELEVGMADGVKEQEENMISGRDEKCGNKTLYKPPEIQVCKRNRIDSRTFSIKDSVARRLSEASPTLSCTVRKQRFSLSICEQGALDTKSSGQHVDGEEEDVFQTLDMHQKERLKSQTYMVKGRGDSDSNNNSDNSSITAGKYSDSETESVNASMIQALSVVKMNKELAEKILLDEMRHAVGHERCNHLIGEARQIIMEDGQSYQYLRSMLTDRECTLIPLICMYLAFG